MTRVAWLVCGGLVLVGVSLHGMFGVFSVHQSTQMRKVEHAMRVLGGDAMTGDEATAVREEWSRPIGWWFLAGGTLTLTLGVLKLHQST